MHDDGSEPMQRPTSRHMTLSTGPIGSVDAPARAISSWQGGTTMATTQVPGATREAAAASAVVWINGRQAVVVAMSYEGCISTCEIGRGWLSQASYLARVVREIGDRQRVLILGPRTIRLALEREYVSMVRRADRFVDVESAGPVSSEELVDRLRILAT
jgi:hypothetical protein